MYPKNQLVLWLEWHLNGIGFPWSMIHLDVGKWYWSMIQLNVGKHKKVNALWWAAACKKGNLNSGRILWSSSLVFKEDRAAWELPRTVQSLSFNNAWFFPPGHQVKLPSHWNHSQIPKAAFILLLISSSSFSSWYHSLGVSISRRNKKCCVCHSHHPSPMIHNMDAILCNCHRL